jgi:hypothetical protein
MISLLVLTVYSFWLCGVVTVGWKVADFVENLLPIWVVFLFLVPFIIFMGGLPLVFLKELSVLLGGIV